MKRLLLLGLCLLCFACAKRPQAPMAPDMQHELWQDMQALSGIQGPYRDQLSMRFGKEGETRRVTAIIWGNNDKELRLDVMAGVGSVIAKIRQDGDHFLIYTPREDKAYFHEGASRPLLRAGVPVPFDLGQLAALLNGHYEQLFGAKYESAAAGSKGGIDYAIGGKLAGTLTLGEKGLPLAWRQKKGGWTLNLGYDETSPLLPRSLKLTNDKGQRAIILVKERENPDRAFDREQMELVLPESATLLPLSKFGVVKSAGMGE